MSQYTLKRHPADCNFDVIYSVEDAEGKSLIKMTGQSLRDYFCLLGKEGTINAIQNAIDDINKEKEPSEFLVKETWPTLMY